MSRNSSSSNKIYVGNLPADIRTKDIEDIFYRYGKIKDIDVKNRRGPPFAFIEFDDSRDAEDAVKGRNNYDYDGYKLRVEFPRRSGNSGSFRGRFGDRDSGRFNGGRDRGSNNRPARSQYKVHVSNLPTSGSWQDLKDHMREAGDVTYVFVHKDGTGIVEFKRQEDMKYAIKKLDDSRFRSHEGEIAYIRIREDTSTSSSSYGNSDRKDYRDGSAKRSRSRSHSRSQSPVPHKSRKPKDSRSRSRT